MNESSSAIYTVVDHVATITLNRPSAMNAVDAGLSGAVGEALEQFESDDNLRVLVLTGNGRAFCAGADLKRIAAGDDTGAPGHPEWGFAGFVEHPISKPVIAAVNGFALGGGTEIVLAADLAVMSSEASLGLPEVKRGLFAAGGGAIRLPQELPAKLAMEFLLTGEPIAAGQALQLGLVNSVVAPGEVMEAAFLLAERIAANAPLSVRTTKRLARAAIGAEAQWSEDVWNLNSRLIDEVFASADAHEGSVAFAEKRQPQWEGR
ncbi:crotonase/enoyl-CoA hydratase family protein [Rhodococcoides fascians]|uniref:crotonase/enoyl-CoA hydratase family protein n=1 Tax=Rhodococcoides fascians TaxID=1828 RepID=UPI0005650E2A|nr:crotonase/enoyl-CoA hydratase family protein [Rhodococcus fascians]